MDADDISLPERLEKQVQFMEEKQHIDACGSYAKIIGIENNMLLENELMKLNNNKTKIYMYWC